MLRSPFERSNRQSSIRTAHDFYVDIDAPGMEHVKERFDRRLNALFENWRARIRGSIADGRSGGNATINGGL